MAYQALYRKWRPSNFSDVVGQDAITNTLKNSIKINKISHAFLFAGPRGTGKTSVAKIFAKAINCLNPKDGEPCNECENCVAANEGRLNDLIEIDAASNNGVDEIRDIRDKVKYAPTQGKYKVYIIDEVHMLSIGAFNALLKTLEEPPEHVVFILATTELQKVPATIISRTQKYTFRQISKADIINRLTYILDAENITYEDRAVQVIAKVADGGMRDALSILDQIISFENNVVTYEDALKITGFASAEKIEQLFINLNRDQTLDSLTIIKELLALGVNPKNILTELIDLATQTLIYLKTGQGQEEFLLEDFTTQIQNLSDVKLLNLIELANDALNDLRYTNQQNIPLDVFCAKVTTEANVVNENPTELPSQDLLKLQKKVEELEQKLNQFTKNGAVPTTAVKNLPKPKPLQKNIEAKYRNGVFKVLKTATKDNLIQVKELWPDLMSKLEVSKRAMMDVSEPVAAGPNACVVAFNYQLWFERAANDSNFLDELKDNLAVLAKKDIDLVLVPKEEWPVLRKEYISLHQSDLTKNSVHSENFESESDESHSENKQENDIIDRARDLFGDANIIVKD